MIFKKHFQPVSRHIPSNGLPVEGNPANETREWMYTDTLEGYKERGGHPIYGEHDIQYTYNSLGYRCPEFNVQADIRVMAIGCSYVLGTGLPPEHTFHELFANKLRSSLSKSVVSWNLGLSAGSNDSIARLLLVAIPILDPHIVVINFTHTSRREYFTVENRRLNFTQFTKSNDGPTQEVLMHLRALTSPHDDIINFFKNYKTVELLLRDRFWLFSHIAPDEFEPIAHEIDYRRYVGRLGLEDKARDGSHPGPKANGILAQGYWDKFIELDGPSLIGNMVCKMPTLTEPGCLPAEIDL